jgi:predicted O-linked N-acetylglucosamine transferase (SPINDLY family)
VPESFAVEPLDPAVPASGTPEPTGQPTPADNTARFAHALALQRAGQTAQAQAVCEQILQLEPHHAGALHLLGLLAVNHGNRERGIELFRASLAANPNQPVAHSNLAAVLLQMNRPGEALASCDQALRLNPNTILALYNRGNILRELKRPEEAVASYERALRLKPDYVSALKNCGIALVELRRYEDALAMFERALKLSPGNAEAYNSHGNTLLVLQRYEEALASYQRALALEPDFVEALNSTSNILGALKRHEEVLVYFSKLLEVAPDYKYAAGSRLHARLHCCDWEGYSQDTKHLIASIAAGKQVELPFPFLAISDRASEQLQCARLFATERGGAAAAPLWQGEHYTHERIRVAYLSADFREHAVSYLMAGVLEQHDRTRFETIAVSLRTEELTPMGQRVKRACDRFVDVSRLSDAQIATRLREWEVDIVVDLVGFTEGVRTGILAQRPVPLQVNYLGFPATMGTAYIDYILADEFVIPAAQRVHYAEQVVYLPECFQANDDRRAIEHTLSRAQCGLPDSAAVLCCFNNSFKLSPGVFEIWLRLLQAVPDSVLWLLGDTEAVQRNLRAYASAHGLSADRLVFAPRLPYAQHLGRMSLADLFLDTLPFNAGTTASDALWAGVPVLTCTGEAFAARMAGSLLTAVGLPQLITHSLPEYEQRAMELLQRPELLADLRATLARHRNTHPLFNTSRFCRHLESAYLTMWQQYQRGEQPEGFTVAPLDPAVSNPS